MKLFVKLVILLLTFGPLASLASDVDLKLRKYIKSFSLNALEAPGKKDVALYNLGKKLFSDKLLSGNRNISCQTCHDPQKASADALPLGLGQGSIDGSQTKSTQLLARHTPHLFNVSNGISNYFWDGRVSFNKSLYIFNTPSEYLNGDYPEAWEITDNLNGALSAQAIFPLLSREEMRGNKGENELADLDDDLLIWKAITKRILEETSYTPLILKAFGTLEINISHIGNALAEFQTHRFMAIDTPWDNYIRGSNNSMSYKEKRGALVFIERGRCIICHSGAHLSNFKFENIASPQLGNGFDIHKNDQGRFENTKKESDQYRFRVPALRNVALTSPYFHSGSYTSLEQVIEHYDQGTKALDNYDSTHINEQFSSNYLSPLFVESERYRIFRKKENAHPIMRARSIRLSREEKSDLLEFLTRSLTDESFKSDIF